MFPCFLSEFFFEFTCEYSRPSRETPAFDVSNLKFIFKPKITTTNPESANSEEHYVSLTASTEPGSDDVHEVILEV